jgi:hypothetical protein
MAAVAMKRRMTAAVAVAIMDMNMSALSAFSV